MPSDSPCPNRQALELLRAGKLSGPEAKTIQIHLQNCETCRVILRSISSSTPATVAVPVASRAAPEATTASAVRAVPGAVSAPAGGRATDSLHYSFLSPPVQPDEIGRLGSYRVLRLLEKGGMGFVFHAEDIALRRPVALKVMQPELGSDNGAGQRFLREARIMAALKHDHLVTVYQVGQEGEAIYLAMELLKGESLEEWLCRTQKASGAAILRLGREIASGLAVIHQNQLVHRDIKPANIWLESPLGRVKILDFGLAREIHDNAKLTRTGTVMGTPSYMSPEQARGDPVDARGDLFSLGTVLYALASGKSPFQGANTMATLTALAVKTPPPVHELNPDLPKPLSDLVMQLLAKRPEERPSSAQSVLLRLQEIEADGTPPSGSFQALPTAQGLKPVGALAAFFKKVPENRRLKIGLAAAAVLLLGLLVLFCLPSSKKSPPPLAKETPSPNQLEPEKRTEKNKQEPGKMYLIRLEIFQKENWPVPRPPPGSDGKSDLVNGKIFPHGIFMHPPAGPENPNGGVASLSYSLGKKYNKFVTEVSLNDTGPPEIDTPITFWVYGDGEIIGQSEPVSLKGKTQWLEASVKDVDVLKIEVNCPGSARGAHAVWLDPYVE